MHPQVRLLRLGTPSDFLGRAVEPPEPEAITAAVRGLQAIQAMDDKQEITPLGFHLANLPVGAKLGKLLIFGCVFRCVEPMLTIAAAMSCRGPFVAPLNQRAQAQAAKMRFAQGQSDLLTIVRAFDAWAAAGSQRYRFCQENFLSDRTLQMMVGDACACVDVVQLLSVRDSLVLTAVFARPLFCTVHGLPTRPRRPSMARSSPT